MITRLRRFRYLGMAGAVGVIGLAIGWGFYGRSAPIDQTFPPPGLEKSIGVSSLPVPIPVAVEPLARSDSGILAALQRHEVDFVSMLAEIRTQCLPEWDIPYCNTMTREFLSVKFTDDRDKKALLEVFDQYVRYEDHVAENRLAQDTPLEALYPALQQARAQFIDPAHRRWLFGVEDARMAYEFALRNFVQEKAADLPAEERLRQLDQLRRETLGQYYDLFVMREPPAFYLQTQLDMLQLTPLDTPAAQALASSLTEKLQHLPISVAQPTETP